MKRQLTKQQRARIRQAFLLLESEGLSVYGPFVDLDTATYEGGYMDYNASDAIRFINLNRLDAFDSKNREMQ